jgi:GNAT superfamily N-acetyltransferase
MSSEDPPELTVVDLADRPDRSELLEEIYARIFVHAFRPDELDPLEVTRDALAEEPPSKDVAAALDPEGGVLGAAIGDWDSHNGVYLLSYLAVVPGLRSRGVGTQLMNHVRVLWRQRQALLAIAEVDDPRVYTVSQVGDPAARLRFYERFDAEVLHLSYTQPRIRPEGSRVPGMLLLTFDVQPTALASTNPPALKTPILKSWLRDYFEGAEGPQVVAEEGLPKGDRLPATPGVALLPLNRYTEIEIDDGS